MVSSSTLGSPLRHVLVALLTAAALVVPASQAQAAEDVLIVEGGGWGHSVGMSQYGAYGMSKEGISWERILEHYYYGAKVATLGSNATNVESIVVGVLQERGSVTFTARATGSGNGFRTVVISQHNLGGSATYELAQDQWVRVNFSSGSCSLTFSNGTTTSPGSCSITISWDQSEGPGTKVEIAERICPPLDGNPTPPCSYARGSIKVDPAPTSGVHVAVHLPLEEYVLGILEMPYGWGSSTNKGMDALRAQAGAARSYAAAKVIAHPHLRGTCACHVYDSIFDQVYVGWGYGQSTWITAVQQTDRKVLVHPDWGGGVTPITAWYSSSTYGRTEPAGIGFGSGSSIPYTHSRDDQWALSPAVGNSRGRWTKEIPLSEAAQQVGMQVINQVGVAETSPSGAAAKITFFGVPGTCRGAIHTSSNSCTFWTATLRQASKLALFSGQITSIKIGLASGGTVAGAGMKGDSVGLQDPRTGVWHLLYLDGRVRSFYYGNPADVPYAGNWNCQSGDTVGLYRRSAGFLFLRNSNTQGIADVQIFYGNPDDVPLAGDWNRNGCATVGIYRPSNTTFYLRNSNTQGVADITVRFGDLGDVPLVGDWNGDGTDTIGVFRPSNKMLYLSNSNTDPRADIIADYSGWMPGDRIVVGDWDGDGKDSVGVFRTSEARFYLRDTFSQPAANYVFYLGEPHMNPVAGRWRP